MSSSRTVAAEIFFDDEDEVLRTLLEVYLTLQCLRSPPDSPIYSVIEEAGRILKKNGIDFETDEGGTKVSRKVNIQ